MPGRRGFPRPTSDAIVAAVPSNAKTLTTTTTTTEEKIASVVLGFSAEIRQGSYRCWYCWYGDAHHEPKTSSSLVNCAVSFVYRRLSNGGATWLFVTDIHFDGYSRFCTVPDVPRMGINSQSTDNRQQTTDNRHHAPSLCIIV